MPTDNDGLAGSFSVSGETANTPENAYDSKHGKYTPTSGDQERGQVGGHPTTQTEGAVPFSVSKK